MAEWISRQQAQKEEKSGLAGPVDWRTVVTISRQPGAGGHTVAQKVCQAMGPGWKVWDREIIDALAESVNMRREMIESLDENVHSWLEQVVRDVFGVTTMETFATAGTWPRFCCPSPTRATPLSSGAARTSC